jgi:hypothetical protein
MHHETRCLGYDPNVRGGGLHIGIEKLTLDGNSSGSAWRLLD